MKMQKMYTATVTAKGGRTGKVKSSDGVLNMELAPPKEMDGPGGIPNPEMLFAAGHAACFTSAVKHSARVLKIDLGDDVEVTTSVSIGPNGKGGFILGVEIEAILGGVTQEQAKQIVAKADTVCAYSNSTVGNIERKVTAKAR